VAPRRRSAARPGGTGGYGSDVGQPWSTARETWEEVGLPPAAATHAQATVVTVLVPSTVEATLRVWDTTASDFSDTIPAVFGRY